jgi:hypothetical protein
MKAKILIIHLILLIPLFSFSQHQSFKRTISWNGVEQFNVDENESISILRFDGSIYNSGNDFLPVYFERFPIAAPAENLNVILKNKIFEPLTDIESQLVSGNNQISNEITVTGSFAFDKKQPFATASFIPIRINEITGTYEKLISFQLYLNYDFLKEPHAALKSATYAENSVLSTGNWYKVAVSNTGIHKISYQQLVDLGMNPGSINPKNLRIYGNGGGMLPENVNAFRYDDLQENAILVSGEEDGKFDPSDYILFYAESPNEWKYSSTHKKMQHFIHQYSDYNYYFITSDMGAGKRIQMQPSSTLSATLTSTTYHDAYHYELESQNLIGTGRMWYGETFDLNTTFLKELNFPELDLNSKVHIAVDVAARSSNSSSFSVFANNINILTLPVLPTNSSNINSDFAKTKFDTTSFNVAGTTLNLKIVYNKPLQSSVGYLNFFTVNVVRHLSFNGGQMLFRDLRTANLECVAQYILSKVTSPVTIWNVSDHINPAIMETTSGNNQLQWKVQSNSLQEFVAIDGSSFYPATMMGKIENQNLHGLGEYDMIIVTHPSFLEQANRLAEFHYNQDNMSVVVVRLPDIYHEFSSGAADITAIRDFVKMMYDKASANREPDYLLLFGDASYDYKDRIANNSNFVPTWESKESLNPVSSYITDDYFGLLDGDNMVDIGIGRLVVATAQQAKTAVDKIIHYGTNTDLVMNDWRNIICLIGDDEDQNLHFNDSEKLAMQIDTLNKNINIDKIYLDAYTQESTPSGEQYPKVTEDITNRVNRGALVINYVGHGGELGLAHERIVKVADINGWGGFNNMPVFLTATCEFSRFDDPKRVSAGELVFLNPNGGGISLFTTTRATYAGGNAKLNKNFFAYCLSETEGKHWRMGDVIRLAKNASGSDDNTRKFALLGDPALNFAFPKQQVVTATINNISILENIDTLKALSEVTITGEMQDYQGQKLIDFNGVLFPIVYDKPSRYSTLANDPASSKATFYIQKNPLYKGKASVVNGEWSFSFIVPKDIAYDYGFGKISYYAKNDEQDASGNFINFMVGGYNQNANTDNTGPQARLYMNDDSFTSGGITDQNPSLLAYISDDSGINTVGNGIGHDIVATLDGDKNYVLNDYYQSNLDDFKNGVIQYPFSSLSNGHHHLSLKVWDINNNSTTVYTEFIVAENESMALESLMNYPNPFNQSTKFTFEHNQADQPLEITIHVYSLEGQLVRTITDQYFASGYKYVSADWNGTDESGSKLRQGMYIYKVLVRNYDGTQAQETSKLIILRQSKQW